MYPNDKQFGFDPANLPMPSDIYNFFTTAGEREVIAKIPGAVAAAPEAIAGTVGRTASALVKPLSWLIFPVLIVAGLGAVGYLYMQRKR